MSTQDAQSFILKWVDANYRSYKRLYGDPTIYLDLVEDEAHRWINDRFLKDGTEWVGWRVLYAATGFELVQDDWTDILVEQAILRMTRTRFAELAETGE